MPNTELPIIEIPVKAQSAPASTHASRAASPRPERPSRLRRALSFGKGNASPTRPRRGAAATFGTSAQRAALHTALCPVGCYAAPASGLDKKHGVPFGAPHRADTADTGAPVHAYSNPTSTLKRTGSTVFGMKYAVSLSAIDSPAVHAYANPASTLKRAGATAFGRAAREEPIKVGTVTPVHAYQGMYSSFTGNGGVMAKYGRPAATRTLCPAHSYGKLPSTLKTSGVAAFARPKTVAKLPPIPIEAEEPSRPASPSAVDDPLDQVGAAIAA